MSDKVLTITLMAIAIKLCSDLGPPFPLRQGEKVSSSPPWTGGGRERMTNSWNYMGPVVRLAQMRRGPRNSSFALLRYSSTPMRSQPDSPSFIKTGFKCGYVLKRK